MAPQQNAAAPETGSYTLKDILTTAELDIRPARTPNYKAENDALTAIAGIMTEAPDVVFQKLADVALELCDAGSAGISISETFEGADIFRWHATSGEYTKYLGGTMPRYFSPCGVVIDSCAPQLMTDMVQYYPYVSALEAPPVEVLLVPFYLDGVPVGTVWVVAHNYDRKFDTEDLRIVQSLTRFASLAVQNMAQESRLKTALDAGRMGTWEFDAEDQLLKCSTTCNANYGVAPDEELSFQKIQTLIHEEDKPAFAATLGRAIETGENFEMQYRVIWPDKSIHWIYVRGNCTARKSGKAKMLSGISIDITNRVVLELTAKEAQKAAEAANIAKSEFLANMSHEIRTPMNAVIGLTSLLDLSHPLNEKQKLFITTLKSSSDALLSLINDLLDFSKIEAHSIELEKIPFSIAQVVDDVDKMMAVRIREKNLGFNTNFDPSINRSYMGDPTRLRQIILNLCSNAIKFTDTGAVTISLTSEPADGKGMETVCISVKDSGIGIAPENIDKIFQKFTQANTSINRKYGGTGLGLSITKNLVEAMGGTIQVISAIGEGSEFKIRIPLLVGSAEHDQSASVNALSQDAPEQQKAKRILLVEDYAPNVLVAQTLLEGYGYEVDAVDNGGGAVEMVKTGQFDAILMDVQMHSMNGLEATRLIRDYERQGKLSHTPIIGMTAMAMTRDKENCLSAGMDDYISKPFNSDDLNVMIGKLVSAND